MYIKSNTFQDKLYKDLKAVKEDNRLTIKAEKTTNYYKMDRDKYDNLVTNVTKTYKKTSKEEIQSINREPRLSVLQITSGSAIA